MDAAESHESTRARVGPARVGTQELERLRRQLRALSLVNRQLHAQLEGGVVRLTGRGDERRRGALTVRRTAEGGAWLEHLHLHGGGDPMLVRTPTQGRVRGRGHMRRPVKSGLLFAALTRVLGAPQEMTDRDVERWSLGPAGRGAGSRHRRRRSSSSAGAACRCAACRSPISCRPTTCCCSPKAKSSTSRRPARRRPSRADRARDVIAKDGVGPRRREARAQGRRHGVYEPPPSK